ncbi:MAG: hypothetical protein AAGI68_15030 [Planctomycetota bacterium]
MKRITISATAFSILAGCIVLYIYKSRQLDQDSSVSETEIRESENPDFSGEVYLSDPRARSYFLKRSIENEIVRLQFAYAERKKLYSRNIPNRLSFDGPGDYLRSRGINTGSNNHNELVRQSASEESEDWNRVHRALKPEREALSEFRKRVSQMLNDGEPGVSPSIFMHYPGGYSSHDLKEWKILQERFINSETKHFGEKSPEVLIAELEYMRLFEQRLEQNYIDLKWAEISDIEDKLSISRSASIWEAMSIARFKAEASRHQYVRDMDSQKYLDEVTEVLRQIDEVRPSFYSFPDVNIALHKAEEAFQYFRLRKQLILNVDFSLSPQFDANVETFYDRDMSHQYRSQLRRIANGSTDKIDRRRSEMLSSLSKDTEKWAFILSKIRPSR